MQFVRRYPGAAPPHPRTGETATLTARPAIEAISDPQGRDGQVEAEPSHHPIPAWPAFEASQ
ncbi:hypothetical protein MTP02_23810 [Streptomyces albus]|nr:hypothetical protein MTP02_23810 [Streptomyces albus]